MTYKEPFIKIRKNSVCSYKDGTCMFCESEVCYVKETNYEPSHFEDGISICCYPKVATIEKILTSFYGEECITMDNFCPVEMMDGFGMEGPKGRIEPYVILEFIKHKISDIFHYLKWYCDGKYTEHEWRELQARILTLKIQEE